MTQMHKGIEQEMVASSYQQMTPLIQNKRVSCPLCYLGSDCPLLVHRRHCRMAHMFLGMTKRNAIAVLALMAVEEKLLH